MLLEVPTTLLLKTTSPCVLRAGTSEIIEIDHLKLLFIFSLIYHTFKCNNVIVPSQVCALKSSGFFSSQGFKDVQCLDAMVSVSITNFY